MPNLQQFSLVYRPVRKLVSPCTKSHITRGTYLFARFAGTEQVVDNLVVVVDVA